jgi:hypothetical protein
MKRSFAVSLLTLSLSLFAQTTHLPSPPPSNENLIVMAREDQRMRVGGPLTQAERAAITRTDADRREAVKKMIANDQLKTGLDYFNAAIILQHGTTSDDYLLAHTLAIIGISKGNKTSLWLSAATLDRYLLSIKQSQIYGTQYNHFDLTKPWTQDPYTDHLIPDGLRQELGVPPIDEQKKKLNSFNPSPLTK